MLPSVNNVFCGSRAFSLGVLASSACNSTGFVGTYLPERTRGRLCMTSRRKRYFKVCFRCKRILLTLYTERPFHESGFHLPMCGHNRAVDSHLFHGEFTWAGCMGGFRTHRQYANKNNKQQLVYIYFTNVLYWSLNKIYAIGQCSYGFVMCIFSYMTK